MERKKGGRREQQAVEDEIHLGGRGDKAAPRNTQGSAKHAYKVADDRQSMIVFAMALRHTWH